MSHDDYLNDPVVSPSLSASIANTILRQSPAHARLQHRRLYPDAPRSDDSRLDIGSAVHSLLLERDDSRFVWVAANDWRTSAAKEARDTARSEGKLPILSRYQGVLEQMCKVARETIAQSELAGMWERGKPEQSLIWQDDGIWCRARPDYLLNDYSMIFEYKSTVNAERTFFSRQIGNMGYSLQAEFYRRGLAALDLHDNPVQVILAQEIESPYACAFFTLSNSYIEIAQHEIERAVATWRMCLQSNIWPAYGTEITVVEPPPWEMAAYQRRLTMESGDWQ